jgi:hypothetical protein
MEIKTKSSEAAIETGSISRIVEVGVKKFLRLGA